MKYCIIWIYRAYFRIINVLGPFIEFHSWVLLSFYSSFVFRLIYHLCVILIKWTRAPGNTVGWWPSRGKKAIYLEQLCINQTKCDWAACKLRIINHLWLWHQVCVWYTVRTSSDVVFRGCKWLCHVISMWKHEYSHTVNWSLTFGRLLEKNSTWKPNSDNNNRKSINRDSSMQYGKAWHLAQMRN